MTARDAGRARAELLAVVHGAAAVASGDAAAAHVEDTGDWTLEGAAWWSSTLARLVDSTCEHVADEGEALTGVPWVRRLACAGCTDHREWASREVPVCDRCGCDLSVLAEPEVWAGFVQRGRVVLGVMFCVRCFGLLREVGS